jgi:hypothetical protein
MSLRCNIEKGQQAMSGKILFDIHIDNGTVTVKMDSRIILQYEFDNYEEAEKVAGSIAEMLQGLKDALRRRRGRLQ